MTGIIQSDVIKWAKEYQGEPYHAMLCDPPYHLTSITKRFGKEGSKPAKAGVYKRASAGFMGSVWDSVDDKGMGVAFDPETWAALASHLYPGAFGMAFASSRGWHRMAAAIEGLHTIPTHQIKAWADLLWIARDSKRWDLVESVELAMREHIAMQEAVQSAGLIIHPSIFMMGWCYLSGFPKATRIDTQIDKAAGAERTEVIGTRHRNVKPYDDSNGWNANNTTGDHQYMAPATDQARDWAGHRYGLQALKPALEPIIVFQRPYEGRPVDNITATGAGSLWIDGGRIGTERPPTNIDPAKFRQWKEQDGTARANSNNPDLNIEQGRWPSNLILSHSPTCQPDACVPGCGVRALDEQSGILTSGKPTNGTAPTTNNTYGHWIERSLEGGGDSGPASRMFYRADWQYEVAEQLANATPLRYEPKASSTEREIGLDGFEATQRLERDMLSGSTEFRHDSRHPDGGYTVEKLPTKNPHPTVKAISLTKYLATLLLPPAAYAPRRILVPFSGVSSEMIGCVLAGWESVTGIESNAEYAAIGAARLAWWSQWPGWGQTDVDKILAVTESGLQPSLF